MRLAQLLVAFLVLGVATSAAQAQSCNDPSDCPDDGCPCTDPALCVANNCFYPPNKDCDIDAGEACHPETGDCVAFCNDVSDCADDGNACTIAACEPVVSMCPPSISVCVQVPIDCNDNDECTIDSCNPASGCLNDPIDCDDNDLCTTDSCDPLTGCLNERIDPADCDDGDPCTTDACTRMDGCVSTPIDCEDGDQCTIDTCDQGTCTSAPAVCDDGDACTTDGCDPATGCTADAIDCDDNDACTMDSCDPGSGCVNNPVSCSDGDPCTVDSCDSIAGCQFTEIPGCNDPGACCLPDGSCQNGYTESQCSTASGQWAGAGVSCQGDQDNNGVDDLCDTAIEPEPIPASGRTAMAILMGLLVTLLVLQGRRRPHATA